MAANAEEPQRDILDQVAHFVNHELPGEAGSGDVGQFAEHTVGHEEEWGYPELVEYLDKGGYGVPILCKYVSDEGVNGEEQRGGIVIPCDHDLNEVVAIFNNGMYCVLRPPKDDDAALQDYYASFMPGHGPFPLVYDHAETTAYKQFLHDASFDLKRILRSDDPKRENDAYARLEKALRDADKLRAERQETRARQAGRLATGRKLMQPGDQS